MGKKILLLGLLIVSFLAVPAKAQTLGGSLMLGIPQNKFGDYVDRVGYGVQIHGTFWTPSKLRPFTLGIDLGYMVYGMETQRRPFSKTVPEVGVDVTHTNSLANFHVLFQVAPFQGTVRPYLEGLFGGNYIFTESKIESDYNDYDIASSTNFDDFTWSYGGGAGLLFQLASDMGDVKKLFLDIKARYLFGTNAQYLTEGSIVINPANGDVTYYVSQSDTDLLTINVGVVAYF